MPLRLTRPASVVCALMTLAGLACFAVAAEDYAIKFDRPTKVEMAYRSTATTTLETKRVVKKDGVQVEEVSNKIVVSLVSDEKVLEVTDKGKAAKLECTVIKCERTVDGRTTEVVPPGKKVLVQRKEKESSYTIDNVNVTKDIADALNLVLDIGDQDKPSEDATFGAADRKKVGDSWKGNTDIMFAAVQKMGMPIQKEGLETSLQLAEVQTAGDKKLMTVRGRVRGAMEKGGRFPGFPEWLSIATGKLDVSLSKTQPVDPGDLNLAETTDMTMAISAAGKAPDGSAISVDASMHRVSQDKKEYK
jgi:hypothetical protein